jgi:hypothetical protein
MRDPESGLAALPRFWKIPVIQEATPYLTPYRSAPAFAFGPYVNNLLTDIRQFYIDEPSGTD